MALTRDARERGGRRRPSAAPEVDLRCAEQEWLSRQLHDHLGPSLCAAGLQLSLLRTEAGGLPAECGAALDNVQSILDNTVEHVRLLSYAVSPGNAARCGLRDMVRMMARAFHADVPEYENVPPASPAAAVELSRQLFDCLLILPAVPGPQAVRVLLLSESVVLDVPGRRSVALQSFKQRALRFWQPELQERARLDRTTLTWRLLSQQES